MEEVYTHPPETANSPLVSVIVPTYNRAELLREALESVCAQNVDPPGTCLEIIVVDDGSDDDTEAVVADMAPVPPVRFISLAHGGYPGRCRNAGAAAAAGRFLAFLDSDDRWMPGKLSRQLSEVERTGLRVCHCRERWLRNGREVSQKKLQHRRAGDIYPDALVKCIVGPSTTVMERSLFLELGGYREDMEIAEDYEFLLRVLAFELVAYVDEPLIEKRAGLAPQLSEKYEQIEGFRIRALANFVAEVATAYGVPTAHRLAGAGVVSGPTRVHPTDPVHPTHPRAPGPPWGSRSPGDVPRWKLVAAAQELSRKCRLFARGAARRGRGEEAERYLEAAEISDILVTATKK